MAKESENDGRVAGACSLLSASLDAWRVVFRDPLVFQGFVYALMASRCHSSNMCLKNIQVVIMQVRGGGGHSPLGGHKLRGGGGGVNKFRWGNDRADRAGGEGVTISGEGEGHNLQGGRV